MALRRRQRAPKRRARGSLAAPLDAKATAQIRHDFRCFLEASFKAIVEVIPQTSVATCAHDTATCAHDTPLEE
jgi:hypothetical protein